MVMFYTLLLVLISFEAFSQGLSPISPREYYQRMGDNLTEKDISNFMDIYAEEKKSCVDVDVFYNAELLYYKLGKDNERALREISLLTKCKVDEPLTKAMNDKKIELELIVNPIAFTVNVSQYTKGDKGSSLFRDTVILSEKVIEKAKQNIPVAEDVKVEKVKNDNKKDKVKKVSVANDKKQKTAEHTLKKNTQQDKGNKIYLGAAESFRYKKGDAGTSRYLSSKTTITTKSRGLEFGLTAEYLTPGKAKEGTMMGSYYNYLANEERVNSYQDGETVYSPYLKYETERYILMLGTTPLGADVSPLPTGNFLFNITPKFSINIFNESVDDSVLSRIGLKDPYSNYEWGRVLRGGGKFYYTAIFDNPVYFSKMSLEYAAYYGENVKNNSRVRGDGVIGKNMGNTTIGIYSYLEHYNENQNNFTLGHGGYYSPDIGFLLTPFISYEVKKNRHKLNLDLGVGAAYENIKSVDKYLKTPETSFLNSSARADYDSRYEGNVKWALSYNIGAVYEYKIENSFNLTAEIRALQSSTDYQEYLFNLKLIKEF